MEKYKKSPALDRDISHAKERIKALKNVPDGSWPFLGGEGYDAAMANAQAQLQSALAAKRATHPIKQQLESAKAYQARAKMKWDDNLAKEAEIQQHVQDWQLRLPEQSASTLEAEQAAS